MGRQIVAIALVLFAIAGFATAATPTPAVSPAANDVIGNTDPASGSGSSSGDDVVAGPVGGPVPDGVFPPTPETTGAPGPSPSGSTVAKVSSVVGVTAAVVAVVFF